MPTTNTAQALAAELKELVFRATEAAGFSAHEQAGADEEAEAVEARTRVLAAIDRLAALAQPEPQGAELSEESLMRIFQDHSPEQGQGRAEFIANLRRVIAADRALTGAPGEPAYLSDPEEGSAWRTDILDEFSRKARERYTLPLYAGRAPAEGARVPEGWKVERAEDVEPGAIRVVSPKRGPGYLMLTADAPGHVHRMLYWLASAMLAAAPQQDEGSAS